MSPILNGGESDDKNAARRPPLRPLGAILPSMLFVIAPVHAEKRVALFGELGNEHQWPHFELYRNIRVFSSSAVRPVHGLDQPNKRFALAPFVVSDRTGSHLKRSACAPAGGHPKRKHMCRGLTPKSVSMSNPTSSAHLSPCQRAA